MFETAEVGAALTEAAFREVRDRLRLELIELQQKARTADFPTLVILSGIRGAGVIDTVNLLNTWMDPRWIATTAFDDPSDEERERPLFWRYWRSLPAAGTVGLVLGGWYQDPIAAYCDGAIPRSAFDEQLLRIKSFERSLADEGALILKFWLHLSKGEQKRRLGRQEKDPLVGLRASDNSWLTPTSYDSYVKAAGYALRQTMDSGAPWFIVEGGDDHFRRATVLSTLAEALRKHLKTRKQRLKERAKELKRAAKESRDLAKRRKEAKRRGGKAGRPVKAPVRKVLDTLNMNVKLDIKSYAKAFHHEQVRLHALQHRAREIGLSTIVALEGWDAAGKGGAIRRLTFALNARDYRIVPIAAPTDEERAHHYLWRFWRHIGRAGRMTIFDRSWYGRVLVERVENLATQEAWMRAYAEINDFEQQLAEHGAVVVKLWLHLTPEEQLKRFKDRSKIAHKRWKLTDEDWRNRDKWDLYEEAVNDMVSRTSTAAAPWHLIAANDKRYTRVKVLQTVADAMETALSRTAKKASVGR
ncbi:MAG: polyphosphate:AMP phosphotransferase [Rhodospirillaceae bacterium]|nr:polyphosphate:AMP phosphotransferase [Rhodospirillaceae bacterium]